MLVGARLQGAWLGAAQLQGAWLGAMQIQRGSRDRTQLQGARLAGAQLQGAWLARAQLQGAWLAEAQLQAAYLSGGSAWRLRATQAKLEQTLLLVGFGNDPPCTAQPPEPRAACPRDRGWMQWIDDWLAHIPNETFRENFKEAARRQLAILGLPATDDPPEVAAEVAATRAAWETAPPVDPEAVSAALMQLACAAEHAPFVARSLLRQIQRPPPDGRDLGEHRAALAKRMVARDCAGAKGLNDRERADLAAIAAGRQ